MTRVGVLTGGGDCPGLDAVIRAAVRRGLSRGDTFLGFGCGWTGLLLDDAVELTLENTSGILPRGGTMLGTSRTNPLADGLEGVETIRRTMASRCVEALIVIGGDGTLGAARDVAGEGIRLVGVPKTIDNDIAGTDLSVGFQTAVQIATDAIDRLHTTAESHNRVMVLEVMGRNVGWIAAYAGMAGGADAILVPELPLDIDAVCRGLRHRHGRGRTFSIVVVAEGTPSEECDREIAPGASGYDRLGGVSVALARQIEARTGYETRVTILGHVQRGGTPTAFDRILATRFGVAAMDAVAAGHFGTMVALRGTEIVEVDLEVALQIPKLLDPVFYETAELFFG